MALDRYSVVFGVFCAKRSLIFATTLGAAQSLAVTHKSKKPAIQALMESATTILKNGATPAVVDFAEESQW